jgi:hypothetical protein
LIPSQPLVSGELLELLQQMRHNLVNGDVLDAIFHVR